MFRIVFVCSVTPVLELFIMFDGDFLKKAIFCLLSKPTLNHTNLKIFLEVFKELANSLTDNNLPVWILNLTLKNLLRLVVEHPLYVPVIEGKAGCRTEIRNGVRRKVNSNFHYVSVFETTNKIIQSDPENILRRLKEDRVNILNDSGLSFNTMTPIYSHLILKSILHDFTFKLKCDIKLECIVKVFQALLTNVSMYQSDPIF